ncbi:DUF6207 family protein [Streptomyces bobili]|uniref:DUF6207 family protein n=1 Tax=Streptomyces bobili TaxID=67280 RepID=UPI00371708A2
MDPNNETHVSEPGLLAVAAADDATALPFPELLAARWATATADQMTRDADEPGVRLRCYPDLKQPVGLDTSADAPPLGRTNSAGPTSKSAGTAPSAAIRPWSTAPSPSAGTSGSPPPGPLDATAPDPCPAPRPPAPDRRGHHTGHGTDLYLRN